jgi:predicted acylesterase/phospholipase RssA
MSKDKAIVLSGGGDKGAFTVGVIKKLVEQGNRYDMISGTSTGALIAPLLAAGEIDKLQYVYTNVKKSDILNTDNPYIRVIQGNSLYDVKPLRDLVRKSLTDVIYGKLMNSGKKVFISTVCLNNSQITYFTNADNIKGNSKYDVSKWSSKNELIECIMASSMQPVLMPPENISGKYFVDGGVREFLPIDIVIDSGASDITGIFTTMDIRYYDPNNFRSIADILLKTVDIFSNDVSNNDLRIAKIYNDGIRYIRECKERIQRSSGLSNEMIETLFTSALDPFYKKRVLNLKIIRPKTHLGSGLDFDTAKMNQMFALGYGSNFDTFNLA